MTRRRGAALLRRAARARGRPRCRARAGARAMSPPSSASGAGVRRHQLRRLRRDDEGVRPPAGRRSGVGRARGATSGGAGARRERAAGRGGAQAGRGGRAARARHVRRALPPDARAARGRPPLAVLQPSRSSSSCRSRTPTSAAAARASTTSSSPTTSDAVLAPKLRHIADTGARLVATGNPGCLMQIGAGLRRSAERRRAWSTRWSCSTRRTRQRARSDDMCLVAALPRASQVVPSVRLRSSPEGASPSPEARTWRHRARTARTTAAKPSACDSIQTRVARTKLRKAL